jgi:hypothetical protein
MTKPITHRALKKRGRKLKEAPADAAARIEALAADGWSLLGIAKKLGTSADVLRRWTDENPALKEALDQGREEERFALHSMLFKKAVEKGDTVAAIFLLKSRHGYREGDQSEQGNRVSINFQLPAALPLENFKVIDHAATTNRLEHIPTSGAASS